MNHLRGLNKVPINHLREMREVLVSQPSGTHTHSGNHAGARYMVPIDHLEGSNKVLIDHQEGLNKVPINSRSIKRTAYTPGLASMVRVNHLRGLHTIRSTTDRSAHPCNASDRTAAVLILKRAPLGSHFRRRLPWPVGTPVQRNGASTCACVGTRTRHMEYVHSDLDIRTHDKWKPR